MNRNTPEKALQLIREESILAHQLERQDKKRIKALADAHKKALKDFRKTESVARKEIQKEEECAAIPIFNAIHDAQFEVLMQNTGAQNNAINEAPEKYGEALKEEKNHSHSVSRRAHELRSRISMDDYVTAMMMRFRHTILCQKKPPVPLENRRLMPRKKEQTPPHHFFRPKKPPLPDAARAKPSKHHI